MTFYSLPLAGHSYALLDDPALTAGQIRYESRACGRERVSTDAPPVQWDTLVALMRRELRQRRW